MRSTFITRLAVSSAFFLLTSAIASAQARIDYEIRFPNAANHEARVTATFQGIAPGQALEARMARSSPGRYAETSFAKNVYDVTATDGNGRALSVTQPDVHSWNVTGHDGTVRIDYTVWGDRTDGTFLGIDRSHAHMNMPATFMYSPAMSNVPIRLTIHPRPRWKIATQLVSTSDTTFTAPNMQWFLDSPTEVGPLTLRSWSASHGGKRYTWRLAVHHLGTEAQVDSFTVLTKKIVDESIALWGEPAAYDHGTYTFIIDYLPWVSGDGMEHRNSTIVTSRGTLTDSASRYARLGTISHEFFHSWNVERLRARSLEPFNFDRTNISDELWFGEGFTSYYGPLIIRRAGLSSDEQFARQLGSAIEGTVNSPGRRHFSAVGMSRQAPFRDGASFLDPVNPNTFISYYTWGSVIALGLDLILRDRYRTTLDEYIRTLWREYGRHQSPALAPTRPYTMQDLRRVLGVVARDTSFANDFFRRYIDGSEVPDFAPLLAKAGFLIPKDSVAAPFLGASIADDSSGVFINWTTENGSMYSTGIANGAVIHTIDGMPVRSADSLRALILRRRVGEVVQLDVTHLSERRTVPMTLSGLQPIRVVTFESAGLPVTEAMRTFRRQWLGSSRGSTGRGAGTPGATNGGSHRQTAVAVPGSFRQRR